MRYLRPFFMILFAALSALGFAEERSHKWPAVQRRWVKTHPACAACGKADQLQVHHKEPFAKNPEKELDPNNLITLCKACHLFIGHGGSFYYYNPNVEADAKLAQIDPAQAAVSAKMRRLPIHVEKKP